jgi:hypothetical protein
MKQILGLLLACLAFSACAVDTSPKNGAQKCSENTSRQCASGFHCDEGFCWKDGTGPGAGGSGGGSGPGIGVGGNASLDAADAGPIGETDAGVGLANIPESGACKASSECTSGFCVDGVCCSSACQGTCMACNLAGKMGRCSPVPAGDLPSRASDCVKSDVTTCGDDGRCDGSGACSKYPDGTTCVAGVCTGAAVTGIKQCQAGKCTPGAVQVCNPFGCDVSKNDCFDTCKADNECAPNQSCKNNSCGKKPLAARCSKADECESNFCADGVCCAQACDGACLACNTVTSPGECVPVPEGKTDPRKICKDDGAAACKTNGACDGKGACSLYSAGTTCASPVCSGNSAVPASTCNGSGSCVASVANSCGAIKCASGVCPRDCATTADCVSPNECVSGSCGLKEPGQRCTITNECRIGVCSADGVCCDKACGGACQACNLPATAGKCTNVTAGATDPHGICTARKQDPTTCKENGLCDGSGGCQNFASGTVCSPDTCSMEKATPASTCDGGGQCVAKAVLQCSPYKCNGSKCGNVCTDDSQCVAPNTCVNGSCGPKPIGAICTGAIQCQSGFCAQGVCCTTACEGVQCKSCNLANSKGTCSLVGADVPDPAGKCTNSNTTCGTSGKCNADGSCKVTSAGIQCGAPVCSSNSLSVIPAATCNGLGACSTPAATMCTNNLTCANGACRTSCSVDGECTAGNFCLGGACKKKPLGAIATSASECASNFRVDGVCCSTSSCSGPMCISGGTAYTPAATCNNAAGICSATPVACTGPGVCGTNNMCKVYAEYEISNYDDDNAVYAP